MNKSEKVLESINPAFAAAGGALAWELLKTLIKPSDSVLQIESFKTYASWQSRATRGRSTPVKVTKINNIYVATDAYQVVGMYSTRVHEGYIIVGKNFWQ